MSYDEHVECCFMNMFTSAELLSDYVLWYVYSSSMMGYASCYVCLSNLISALMSIHVHGAVCPYAWCWSRPLHRSEGWGRDSMVSELKVATMGLYGPRRCSDRAVLPSLFSSEQMDSEKSSKCEQSDHRRKWNSTVAGELEKFLFVVAEGFMIFPSAVAGEWLKSPIRPLRTSSQS